MSLSEKIKNEYQEKYLEVSKKITYLDLDETDNVEVVMYKDLPKTVVKGFPVASDFIDKEGNIYSTKSFLKLSAEKKKECELRYFFLPKNHELYVGATGSGKTTGCVVPQLRAIASKKNKSSLFITDPKGELFDKNADFLQKQGYKTFVLNFKNTSRSDRWSVFEDLYSIKIKTLSIGKGMKYKTGIPSASLELYSDISDFNSENYIEYDGKAFANGNDFDEYVRIQKDLIEAELDSSLNELANTMIVVQSRNDKTWEYGAIDLLKGIIRCMLTDLVNPKSGFTKDMLNLNNLQFYYTTLKNTLTDSEFSGSSQNARFNNHPLLVDKDVRTKALLSAALNNSPNTMRNYCGVFDNSMTDWFQAHIYALTNGNNIDIDNIPDDQPYAIFLITRDYEKNDYRIAGIFIDYVYRHLIMRAECSERPREFHFLLDEFGNVPKIKDFENKIATARSRNIWFHLYLQSYFQLDAIYTADVATIIRDNCSSQIFLGAQNRATKEDFSKQCGMHYVPSFSSYLNNESQPNLVEVPLVPVSSLDLIEPGEIYTKRTYKPVMVAQFIRSYVCGECGAYQDYQDVEGLKTCVPHEHGGFNGPQYIWPKLQEMHTKKKKKIDLDDILGD